ncbi:unknown [Choristoneura occidentalis granulovirus]|uniref:Uncharacterized protein n=1 Tax=Choristoneura occidentalis granulovirus TaxID=364745 RepID=Q1A4L7_9BBAC|nr:unknown [Choristoneura fumiferana granulovirus]ABC61213.1 unknown [Choristoneura fumiferana granulovirus]
MNNHIIDNYHNNRYHHIEKVQKELLQQHKHIESQLNQLKDSIRTMCHSNGGVNCGDSFNSHHLLSNKHYAIGSGHPYQHRTHSVYEDQFKVRKF